MKLSEVPLEKLQVGDVCISAIGNRGYIAEIFTVNGLRWDGLRWVDKDTIVKDSRLDIPAIKIRWENNNYSVGPFDDEGLWYWNQIKYIGQEKEKEITLFQIPEAKQAIANAI